MTFIYKAGGRWDIQRYRKFIISQLRAGWMKWPPKSDCIKKAFVKDGPNPATGHRCRLHRCNKCKQLFAKKDIVVDHIDPVVSPDDGFVDWNTFIDRLFCEEENLQALCKGCHKLKTQHERLKLTWSWQDKNTD